MDKNEDYDLPPPPNKIINVFSIAIWAFAVAAFVYFINFHSGWGNQEQFGQFGDFIGGTLNPFLSFLTIVLLIWSIRIQMYELRLTRREMEKTRIELEKTAKAQSESYQLQLNEVSHRQLDDALSNLYSELETIWHTKAFNNLFNLEKTSLFEIFEGKLMNDELIARNIKTTAKFVGKGQQPGSVGIPEVVPMFESIISILDTINKLTIDLIESTEKLSLKEFYEHKAKKINYKFNKFGLYDDEKYDLLNEKLTEASTVQD